MSNPYEFPKERTYTLKAGRCEARIVVNPANMAKVHGPRFDHLGVVRQVSVSGQKFLHPAGLSDEFGIHGEGVLGYGEKGMRDQFLKIGLGCFKGLPKEPYTFWEIYPLVEAFRIESEATQDSLTSLQRGELQGQYGYAYRKSYTLNALGDLLIRYELQNTGAREFLFEHYNHNWIRLAGERPNEYYRFAAAFDYGTPPPRYFQQTKEALQLVPMPQRGAWKCYHASDKPISKNKHSFSVRHLANGQCVSMEADHKAQRFALYTDRKAFCPETFFLATLEPGKVVKWSRRYRFEL